MNMSVKIGMLILAEVKLELISGGQVPGHHLALGTMIRDESTFFYLMVNQGHF